MKVLELFAGVRSIGKAFEKRGHSVFSIDWDKRLEGIDWYRDISNITAGEILKAFGRPDVIWASPDCTTFSVCAIGKHRIKDKETGYLYPVTEYAKYCDATDIHVLELIKELDPKVYFIENPRGGMRKMPWMEGIPRYTVTYCKYGDKRMKPTDIWTNHPNPKFLPPCKRGDPCHERAPRGSQAAGTQGLQKSVSKKSKIPEKLCEHIVDICEEVVEEEERRMTEYIVFSTRSNLKNGEEYDCRGRIIGELIRCKDCKFFGDPSKCIAKERKGLWSTTTKKDDYCSYAERKDDETD